MDPPEVIAESSQKIKASNLRKVWKTFGAFTRSIPISQKCVAEIPDDVTSVGRSPSRLALCNLFHRSPRHPFPGPESCSLRTWPNDVCAEIIQVCKL